MHQTAAAALLSEKMLWRCKNVTYRKLRDPPPPTPHPQSKLCCRFLILQQQMLLVGVAVAVAVAHGTLRYGVSYGIFIPVLVV